MTEETDFKHMLSQSCYSIITKHIFFAGKLYTIRHELDHTVDTAATDGKNIYYNYDYFKSLSTKQRLTLICHEEMHILLAHHLRMRNKDVELWNVACDYVINLILVQMKFEPLDNWLFDEAYKGLSAECIYKMLSHQSKDQQDTQKQQSKESGGSFIEPLNDQGGMLTPSELEAAVQDQQTATQEALDQIQRQSNGIERSTSLTEQSKQQKLNDLGHGIGNITNRLCDIKQSRIDWKSIVRQFLFDCNTNDLDFRSLDLDQMFITNYKFAIPDQASKEFGNIALCLDVSGSLSQDSKSIASEAFHALSETNKSELLTYYISTYIHKKVLITSEDDIEIVEGGGTNFNCFFNEELEKEFPCKGVIFVTDGCVNFTKWEEPTIPVLWVLTRTNDYFEKHVPFGEVVRMN